MEEFVNNLAKKLVDNSVKKNVANQESKSQANEDSEKESLDDFEHFVNFSDNFDDESDRENPVTGELERELEELTKGMVDATVDPESDLMHKFQSIIGKKLRETLERLTFENQRVAKSLDECEEERRKVGMRLHREQLEFEEMKSTAKTLMDNKMNTDRQLTQLKQVKVGLENDLLSVGEGIKEERKLIQEAQEHRKKIELEIIQLNNFKKTIEADSQTAQNMVKKTARDMIDLAKAKDGQDAKLDQLSWVLDKKKEEISTLEQEIATFDAQNRRLIEECDSLETSRIQREVMVKMARNRLSEVYRELENSNVAMHQLEKQCESLQIEAKTIEIENKKIVEDQQKEKNIRTELNEKKKIVEDQLERCNQDMRDLKKDSSQAKKEIEKFETLKNESEKTIAEHKNLIVEKRNCIMGIEKNLEKMREEKDHLYKVLMQTSLAKCLNEKRSSTIEKDIEKTHKEIENLEKKKTTLAHRIAKDQNRQTRLEDDLANYEIEQNRLAEACDAYEHDLDATVSKLAAKEKSLMGSQQRIEQYNKKIAQAKAKNGGIDASPYEIEAISIKKSIVRKKQEQRETERNWLKTRDILVAQQEKHQQLQGTVHDLMEKHAIMKKQEVEANRNLEEVEQHRQSIDSETERLQAVLERLGSLYSNEEKEVKEVEKSVIQIEEAYKISLDDSQKQIEEHELKIARLRDEIENLVRKNYECELSIGTWCEKLEILKEVISSVENKDVKADMNQLNLQLHNMQLERSELKKQQEQMLVTLEKIANFKCESLFSFKKFDNDVERIKSLKAASKANLDFKVSEKKRELRCLIKELQKLDVLIEEKKATMARFQSSLSEVFDAICSAQTELAMRDQQLEDLASEKMLLQMEVAVNQEIQKRSRHLLDHPKSLTNSLEAENASKIQNSVADMKQILEEISNGTDAKFIPLLTDIKNHKIISYVKDYLTRQETESKEIDS